MAMVTIIMDMHIRKKNRTMIAGPPYRIRGYYDFLFVLDFDECHFIVWLASFMQPTNL